MPDTTTELDRLDEAFAGNLLLATFAGDVRGLFEPYGEIIDFTVGERDPDPRSGRRLDLLPVRNDHDLAGRRAAGRPLGAGRVHRPGRRRRRDRQLRPRPRFCRGEGDGRRPAMRVPMKALEEAKGRSSFVAQPVLPLFRLSAGGSHAVGRLQQLPPHPAARGAMAADRAGPRRRPDRADAGKRSPILLGVQRTTVNAVVGSLQDLGLISARRGRVIVVDRAGLKRHACECYEIVEQHFGAVIGPSGSGGSSEAC